MREGWLVLTSPVFNLELTAVKDRPRLLLVVVGRELGRSTFITKHYTFVQLLIILLHL